MSAWRLVAHFAIPPALVLTILLVLPTPRIVKQGLLQFTRTVLFFPVLGGLMLVHFMIGIMGITLAASSVHLHHLASSAAGELLTPNQRAGVLSRKWREERNWWVAAIGLLLWSLLYRFYIQQLEYMAVKDKNRALRAQVAQLTARVSQLEGHSAPEPAVPSAPPVPDLGPAPPASLASDDSWLPGKQKAA